MTDENELPAADGATIAIIDDDDELRGTMTALLGENGFATLPLPSADAYRQLDPPPRLDLALIDLNLAGESGLELAMEIRARLGIPIVMLTGWGTETDRIEGLETGADDYLMKPFNPPRTPCPPEGGSAAVRMEGAGARSFRPPDGKLRRT